MTRLCRSLARGEAKKPGAKVNIIVTDGSLESLPSNMGTARTLASIPMDRRLTSKPKSLRRKVSEVWFHVWPLLVGILLGLALGFLVYVSFSPNNLNRYR